ncbi:hypothetical protein [Rhizobium leguminosarum]
MRLVANSAAGTIDPHINYTLQYWQIYQALYDGLIAFKKVAEVDGFAKVQDTAEENIKQFQKKCYTPKVMIVGANIANRKFIEVSLIKFI